MDHDRVPPDTPRSLKSPAAIAARRAMLDRPHIVVLRDYAAALRPDGRGTVPEFDPLDGGTNARLLFLMEKPGQVAVQCRHCRQGT